MRVQIPSSPLMIPVRLAASRLALTQETEVRILDREPDPC